MDAERQPEQPVWDAIRAQGVPDLLLLLGDLVYMDWGLASLARVPAALKAWNDAKLADRRQLLQGFAEDMHARYAAQWQVAGLRRLLQDMPTPRRVMLSWDDHDFAWNNAIGRAGQGGPGLNDKLVPPALKRVSGLLRQQFMQRLQGDTAADYPSPPAELADINPEMADVDPAPARQVTTLGGVTVAVLDQRFSRTSRDAAPARLLSEADHQWLQAELARPAAQAGLLILAGGSPLKHASALGGHSSWWAGPGAAGAADRRYPEYDSLLHTQRPVLYLSGEVHRNAWGGWVERPPVGGGPRLPVLQALSSGAGLGRLFFHRFPGAWGRVTVQGSAMDGLVEVGLHTLPDLNEVRTLHLAAGRLREDAGLEGECTRPDLTTDADQRLLEQVGAEPVPVLCLRVPLQDTGPGQPFGPGQALDVTPDALDGQVFGDQLAAGQEFPLACTVSGQGALIRVRRPQGATESDRVNKVLAEAFDHPLAATKGVVLFLHGFGKGFAAAVTQAAELQARHGCRVVLVAWPSGGGEGLLALAGSLSAAERSAAQGAVAMVAAVASFMNFARYRPGVKAQLLARSLGALALAEAARQAPSLAQEAAPLHRVLLSAPACNHGELKHLAPWNTELVLTVNRQDRTLKWADWVRKGEPVGHDPGKPLHGRLVYLDCTGVPGVGQSHDYLLRDVNAELAHLQGQLLRGHDVDWAHTGVPGLVVQKGPP